jgi:hypothetical protein
MTIGFGFVSVACPVPDCGEVFDIAIGSEGVYMPGVIEDYVKNAYHSEEFGSVWTANAVMPDGRLGMAEKRSHFEFQSVNDGQYEAVLARRTYLHQDGHVVGIRDLNGKFDGPRSMGSFENLDGAKEYASQFIADYKQTAREEYAHAVKYQQREDHYAVHGAYPKHEKEKEAVRGPRVRM